MKSPALYIMASRRNGTIYVGVTADLARRAFEHREGMMPGFTRRYGCKMLVYYETHEDMVSAIGREKQLKAGSRKQKLALIEAMNSEWRDLYPDLAGARAVKSKSRIEAQVWIASLSLAMTMGTAIC